MNGNKIPVTLVTGFLGAGKTTFLNAFMTDPRSTDTAVIVNEFGEVDLDRSLLTRHSEDLFVSSAGCLCCTAGSDLRDSLLGVHNTARAKCVGLTRVVVETTGLADPTPIIAGFYAQPSSSRDVVVAQNFELSQVVTLVDAIHGEATLDRHFEALRQVAFADTVVLTKTDMASDPASQADTRRLISRIAAISPGVRCLDRHTPAVDDLLLENGSYSPEHRPEDARAWLAAEAFTQHDHSHEHHDRNRHDDRVRAYCLTQDAPIPADALQGFLNLLVASAGPRLLRIKGLIATLEDPDRPTLIHAVQSHVQPPRQLQAWPDGDRRSQLVVIGRDLEERGVSALFEALIGRSSRSEGWVARLGHWFGAARRTSPEVPRIRGEYR